MDYSLLTAGIWEWRRRRRNNKTPVKIIIQIKYFCCHTWVSSIVDLLIDDHEWLFNWLINWLSNIEGHLHHIGKLSTSGFNGSPSSELRSVTLVDSQISARIYGNGPIVCIPNSTYTVNILSWLSFQFLNGTRALACRPTLCDLLFFTCLRNLVIWSTTWRSGEGESGGIKVPLKILSSTGFKPQLFEFKALTIKGW